MQESFKVYQQELQDLNKIMRDHILFSNINDIDDLRYFMQYHVFAVWDFMSLAKRLQLEFTCVTLPWIPKKNNNACRAMNEIILGEESDEGQDGSHVSHYEMYLDAMDDIKGNKKPILEMVKCFETADKDSFKNVINKQDIPDYVKNFVMHSLDTAINGKLESVLGSFFYGREDAIPEMFSNLLKKWGLDEEKYSSFVYYLKRHIELDSESHGPAVNSIIADIKDDTEKYTNLFKSAIAAVKQRINLWDGIHADLEAKRLARKKAV